MKILHIVDKGEDAGGLGRHVLDLTQELRARGHRIELLRLYRRDQAVTAAHALPWTFGPAQGWRVLSSLSSVVTEFAPDVVHLHAGYTTFSPLLLRALRRMRPVVGTLHDVRPFCLRGTRRFHGNASCERHVGAGCVASGCYRDSSIVALPRLARELLVKNWLLREWRNLPQIIVPSAYLGNLALQHGFAPERVTVVNYFIASLPAVSQTVEQVPLIVYLGALEPDKGPQLVLEALARLRDLPWQAAIIGQGSMRQTLEQYVAQQQLDARVRFHGWLAHDACQRVLARSHALVFPSLVAESFGLSGLEALANARPVVGFGNGGTSEWLIDGQTGLRAADGDSADLARALAALLRDPALAARLGRNGRQLVQEHFTPQARVADVCAVYERAMQTYQARAVA